MAAAEARQVWRFRGSWRSGESYDARDCVTTGRWSFSAKVPHVSGPATQPGHGDRWPAMWEPIDGVEAGIVKLPASLVAAPPPVVTAMPFAVAPMQAPTSAPIPAPVPAPAAPDDCMTGEFWLDAARQEMRTELAKRDAVLRRIAERLEAAVARTGLPEPLDPIAAEAWRRKAELLGAVDRAGAERLAGELLREMVRLLRKRDRAETYTPAEATRVVILDALDRECARIDEAAAALAAGGAPDDIGADRHWPRIGGRS